MKKIISFSLWGNNPKYTRGAVENVILQKQYYPDWICRFYVHDSVPKGIVSDLLNLDCEIVYKNDDLSEEPEYKPNQIHRGHFWRFEVLADKSIDFCTIRDIDSRLGERDRNCVLDWVASGKEFHIMRDHPLHGVPIIAGGLGATRKFINRIDYFKLYNNFNKPLDTRYGGYDQHFLAEEIYPLIHDSLCVHDSHPRLRYEIEKNSIRQFPAITINYPAEDHIIKPFN